MKNLDVIINKYRPLGFFINESALKTDSIAKSL